MAFTIVLHIQNSDAVVGEIDELPTPRDHLIPIKNPRRMDGKELVFIHENATMIFWPVERLNFLEVLSSEEEDQIIGFVRE